LTLLNKYYKLRSLEQPFRDSSLRGFLASGENKMAESLKELSRLLKESKLKIADFNSQSKAEGVNKIDLENRLIAAMDAAGTEMVKNEFGSFSRTETILPVAKDWELIYDYVKEFDAFELLAKSIKSDTYRKLLEMEEEVPGVETYTKVAISVRKPSGT